MASLYVCLVDAGFGPEYLDRCTLLDLDLFSRALVARSEKQATGRSAKRSGL